MPFLERCFDELRQKLGEGVRFSNTGDDPVYYLIFEPQKMLDVKRAMKQWRARLQLDGWSVNELSMADVVEEIIDRHPLRDLWVQEEMNEPHEYEIINKTLSEVMMNGEDNVVKRVQEAVERASAVSNGLLFITDLEAIHPYFRIGMIENKLQGRFAVPTVVLYPGVRDGQFSLSFLGIYPEDGNYRSSHISC
jgi:hypothetical protein